MLSNCVLIHPLQAYPYHFRVLHPIPHLLPRVHQACCTISILCSHSLQCGIIINSHLGEGCFPHHQMQWRFIATISQGWGRWKLCTYTTGCWVTTVWPCKSSEVDGDRNWRQMLRTVNEWQSWMIRKWMLCIPLFALNIYERCIMYNKDI